MIVTKTPLPLVLCGEGTDHAEWFRQNGGMVLGGTINQFYRHVADGSQSADFWDVAHWPKGVEVERVGRLQAHYSSLGQCCPPKKLAEIADPDEGCGEAVLSAYGGMNLIRFARDDFSVQPIPLGEDHLASFQNHLLIFLFGKENSCGMAPPNKLQDKHLWAMMKLTELALDAILGEQWEKLGSILDDVCRSTLGTFPESFSREFSRLYAAARIFGAYGGKPIRSGLLLIAPPEKCHKIITKMAEMGCWHIPAKFYPWGSMTVFVE